jgi:hypothetical protein
MRLCEEIFGGSQDALLEGRLPIYNPGDLPHLGPTILSHRVNTRHQDMRAGQFPGVMAETGGSRPCGIGIEVEKSLELPALHKFLLRSLRPHNIHIRELIHPAWVPFLSVHFTDFALRRRARDTALAELESDYPDGFNLGNLNGPRLQHNRTSSGTPVFLAGVFFSRIC